MTGGPLVQARNFAVLTGVNAGISCAMKRIRGVDDIQNRFSRLVNNFFNLVFPVISVSVEFLTSFLVLTDFD